MNVKNKPVVPLTGVQAPAAIRRSAAGRVGTWLKNRKVKDVAPLAQPGVGAAKPQHTTTLEESLAATLRPRMANVVLALH